MGRGHWYLIVCVAVPPHWAALVDNSVDHDADSFLPVHLALEHLCLCCHWPNLLLSPHTLHHLLPHQLQQVWTAINFSGDQSWNKTLFYQTSSMLLLCCASSHELFKAPSFSMLPCTEAVIIDRENMVVTQHQPVVTDDICLGFIMPIANYPFMDQRPNYCLKINHCVTLIIVI